MSIGERIRERREALNLTQMQLAVAASTQPTYISRIERGEIHSIGTILLVRLAQVLGCTPNDLLGVNGTKRK